ncbi:MAG: hypothetical protein D4R70_03305 [Betaproteobacteria bacterium]|nr:MAG: hypothetical protein D4R70_03305 [Betaproteobacteria bacterium]
MAAAASPSVETKLAAARTRLILDQPFLGSLVMHLPLTVADKAWCKTTATDARALYYNADYIAALTLEQTQFVLAHEAMHCAMSHFARREHREKHRWDVACDYAVNMILDDENLRGPPNALTDAKYRGLTAEEIYPILHQDTDEQPMDQHLFDQDSQGQGGQGQSEPGEGSENNEGGEGEATGHEQPRPAGQQQKSSEALAAPPSHLADDGKLDEQWRGRLAAAAQSARQAGKLSASLQRFVDELIAPQVSWRALLADYLVRTARDDYSFQRPSRRESAAMLPRLSSLGIRLVVAVDTSGSIQAEELTEFLSEVDAIKAQVRADVALLACDERLAEGAPWLFSVWEAMALPIEMTGGGGTDFRPVFAWVERENANPDALLYFTDAEGVFPSVPPPYPVLWLVKGRAPVPFGVRVALN